MTERNSAHARAIEKIAAQYRERGYRVEVEPHGSALPEFLAGFQPDLIARSPSDSVVVEVKTDTRMSAAERLRDVSERVNREPGWRFSLVFANPKSLDDVTDETPLPISSLVERVNSARGLIGAGQLEAAFLLLFSALEGALRLLSHRAQLPLENLPSSALIRELYSAGEISREQFESALKLLPIRNQVAHGFATHDAPDVESLQHLVGALLEEAIRGESQRQS